MSGAGRTVHPLAWWAWALGVAVAVSRTADPAVVGSLLAATTAVVLVCRDASPWARAFPAYLVLGLAIVVVRVLFYVVLGLKAGGAVVLDLPRVPLPGWARGFELFGPVHAPGLLAAASGGLRLAALVVCFGAANALANPKRALRSLPASLNHVGTAVIIAVTVTPQLVASVRRVRAAQRLRGRSPRGVRSALSCVIPVLQDSLDRSLALAASMDSRGYARSVPGRSDARVTALLLGALVSAVLGTYGLLDGQAPRWLGLPVLAVGAAAAVLGSWLAGRRVERSRYRPDPWGPQEWALTACGLGTAVSALVGGAPAEALAVVLAVVPGVVAPRLRSALGPTATSSPEQQVRLP